MTDTPNADRRHVLLVEDHPVNQKLAQALLTRRGFTVSVANHGEEALELLAREPNESFALILMDMQMPVMDGLAATRRIREDEANSGSGRHIPILAMTANAMSSDKAQCLAAGMDGYLAKPIRQHELDAELQRLLPAK